MSKKYEELVSRILNLADTIVSELDKKKEKEAIPQLQHLLYDLQVFLDSISTRETLDEVLLENTDEMMRWGLYSLSNLQGTKYIVEYEYDEHWLRWDNPHDQFKEEYNSIEEAYRAFDKLDMKLTNLYWNSMFPPNLWCRASKYEEEEENRPYEKYLRGFPIRKYCPEQYKT